MTGDTTDCSGHQNKSLLSSTYKSYQSTVKLNTICSWELFGITDTDEIFCIHPILEKQWQYNEAVYQLFRAFLCSWVHAS